MGAHHARTTTIAPLARVAGRGVLTATAALALTGAGAGAALAHDGSHGSDHERDDSASSQAELCDVFGEVDGGMSDAGMDMPGFDDSGLCSPDDDDVFEPDASDSGHDDSADPSAESSSPTPAPSSPSATPAASPASTAKPASATPARKLSPQDMPPAPGQTKTLQIPARTTS